jgi:curved DNA-binding protein CbpA
MATMTALPDPYQTLGVRPSASDAELRAAYRRLVQLHHPDHNGGSPGSARRFEEVQDAYAAVRRLRQGGAGATGGRGGTTAGAGASGRRGSATDGRGGTTAGAGASGSPGASGTDPGLDARLAEMERQLKDARDAREQAVREARRAQEQALRDVRAADGSAGRDRPSDEELGYFSTTDSLSKIIDDAASELSGRLAEVRGSPAAHRVADLIDELTAKLTGEPPDRKS